MNLSHYLFWLEPNTKVNTGTVYDTSHICQNISLYIELISQVYRKHFRLNLAGYNKDPRNCDACLAQCEVNLTASATSVKMLNDSNSITGTSLLSTHLQRWKISHSEQRRGQGEEDYRLPSWWLLTFSSVFCTARLSGLLLLFCPDSPKAFAGAWF